MRKLYAFNMVTLDAFFEGPNQDISWHNVDDEFNEFAIDQLKSTDTLVFGRVTYQMMASYWPTSDAIKNDPMVAGYMNRTPKIVVSRTLRNTDWNNTRLVKDYVAEEIAQLKQQPGKDIAVFGSANLLSTLIPLGLVDEHRIMINPVILGKGTPLFKNSKDKLDFKLVKTHTFGNGNVLLYYQPAKMS
ncbi:MAG: dihydrofolate reductase [Chloroflexi bacterium]|nr:dihydrofolate reductase [Chloroflexota bacterium]